MTPTPAKPAIRGAMTAMVTPFRDGAIDWPRLENEIERQISGGTDWLVPCGTTGESPTLSHDEHGDVIEFVIKRANGRIPVMAGTGSNSTDEAIMRTRHAADAGAQAALIVAPYYNRPPAEGLYRHFAAIAESVDIPIVLYNVPFRTGVNISNDVIVRLRRDFKNIVALKHATGSVDGVTDLVSRCDIIVLSGDDSLTWPLMSLGAKGLISVVANLCPSLVKSLVAAGLKGNQELALRHHAKLYAIAEGLAKFGPNPIPIKTAMAIAGYVEEEFRLPLCPVAPEARAGIEKLLQQQDCLEAMAV